MSAVYWVIREGKVRGEGRYKFYSGWYPHREQGWHFTGGRIPTDEEVGQGNRRVRVTRKPRVGDEYRAGFAEGRRVTIEDMQCVYEANVNKARIVSREAALEEAERVCRDTAGDACDHCYGYVISCADAIAALRSK